MSIARIRPPAPAPLLALSLALLVAAAAAAQTLDGAMCPPAPPFNFELEPPLDEFLAGQPGIPLLKRTLDTALHPEAVCNDGSPAVMYLRPAHAAYAGNPINTPSRKWIVFLDGGGACRTLDECLLERWCGAGGKVFDRAGKMSTLGAFDAIRGHGIFRPQLPNGNSSAFRDYNHVLVHYCSSDNWLGSASYAAQPSGIGQSFDIEFQGEAIVNAVFDTLLAGATAPDAGPAAAFYATALPDLSSAETVILAGESAGGGGLRHHLDRLHYDVLLPDLTAAEPKIRGLIDAGTPPHLGGPNLDWSDPGSPADYADYLATEVEPSLRTFWGAEDSALDQSCLDPAWQASHDLEGGHPRVCYDNTYILLNHITTPVFLRQEINDPLAKQKYEQWNLYPTTDDYWADQYAQLLSFAGYSATAGGLEPPDGPPGIQGIHCNRHVSVQTDDGFYRHRVTASGVLPRFFHDLLNAWLASGTGGPQTQQIQEDVLGVGAYSASDCP